MASWFKFIWDLKYSPCSEYLIFLSVTMEVIWRTHNEAVHSNVTPSLSRIIPIINSSALSFGQDVASISECPVAALWEHPPEDWCKINFNNSIQKDALAVVAICRDSTGSVLGIETKLHPSASPLLGECLAAKLAIELAISLKISHLIIEGDSLVAIQSLTLGPDLCQWEISNIIFDCCKLLECVSFWSASHI